MSTGGAPNAGGAGAAAGGGGGVAARPPEIPPSDSQADLASFLTSGKYKVAPWISESAEPRESIVGSQHGDGVRVWGNPTLVAALAAGRDGIMGHEYPDPWSMAVKEMFDANGELVGIAAALKTLPGSPDAAWTYFCYGPAVRCASKGDTPLEKPVYGNGADMTAGTHFCRFCHGNTIITQVKAQ